jgi:hypothetical protein
VIFQPGVQPDAVRVDVGGDVVEVEVPADVPVVLAVVEVAGVTLFARPDLLAALRIAPEGRHAAARTVNRRENTVNRLRRGIEDAVRVHEEVADALFGEHVVAAREVPALGQPDAGRGAAEDAPVVRRGHGDLRLHGRAVMVHQRQEPVRRGAGDDLQATGVLQAAVLGQQVSVQHVIEQPGLLGEPRLVESREAVEVVIALRAADLLVGELAQAVEVSPEALHQQAVLQHVGQRRGHAEGETGVDAVGLEPAPGLDQGQVRLADGLEEPALFEEERVFRVADVRQVMVQDHRQRALRGGFRRTHRRFSGFGTRWWLPAGAPPPV